MTDFLFWTKKFLTFCAYPAPIVLALIVLGCWQWWRGRNLLLAKVLIALAGLWLLVCSTPYVPSWVVNQLECQYHRLGLREQILAKYPEVERINYLVVLGGGANNVKDPTLNDLMRLPIYPLRRVVEAVRLHQYFPQTKIIMMGGGGESLVMAGAAQILGVAPEDLISENKSRDTEDQSIFIKPIVHGEPFILITSAWHMPRSAGLFKRQRANFIPDPVDFLTSEEKKEFVFRISCWTLPNTNYLILSELATKEYLGILVAKVRGTYLD